MACRMIACIFGPLSPDARVLWLKILPPLSLLPPPGVSCGACPSQLGNSLSVSAGGLLSPHFRTTVFVNRQWHPLRDSSLPESSGLPAGCRSQGMSLESLIFQLASFDSDGFDCRGGPNVNNACKTACRPDRLRE